MGVGFCIEALEEALARHGKPEIFNTDQGSQFTSVAFTQVLKDAGVRINMDGRGRWTHARRGVSSRRFTIAGACPDDGDDEFGGVIGTRE